jgi:DNA methyltransferase 1-associated protein 1
LIALHCIDKQDPEWTLQQTRDLFDLCEQFDLRFIVIIGRFRQMYPDKTIEDIRDRYYSITRKLLQLNNPDAEELSHMPIFMYPYNKGTIERLTCASSQLVHIELMVNHRCALEHEVKRKVQAEKLYARSRELVQEEEQLAIEYKRIEAEQRKQQLERKRVLKLTESLADRGPVWRVCIGLLSIRQFVRVGQY